MRAATACLGLLLASAPLARAGAPPDAARAAAVVGDARRPVAERVEAARSIDAVPEAAQRERVLPPLLDALADASPDVRAASAGALARIRDGRALPRVTKRLAAEADEGVLAALLLAAGALGGPDDATYVVPFASHASARVRAAAATSLGDLGGGLARDRLLAMLGEGKDDPEWIVRGAAVLALATCGRPEDAGAVYVAYRDGGGVAHWFARASLARAVAALDADPVPTLDRLVGDPDSRVATAAASGFLRAGRPEEVGRRLSDPRPGARGACAAAVAEAGLAAFAPTLVAMATKDPDRAVRWTAALALSRLDDPASDALLLAGLASDDPEVWASALVECRRKTGRTIGRDVDAWRDALAARRGGGSR